ncbi:MAG: YIP1 family protein [Oscillochloris sp.]|nr:YIP1 family protein [Oscillochloris sp.]
MPVLLRLAIGGLFLDPQAYRDQRDAPNGFVRGLALVVLVSVIVALSSTIGNFIERLAAPSGAVVTNTLADGIRALPLYEDLSATDPTFEPQMDELFSQLAVNPLISGGDLLSDLAGILLAPVFGVIGWLIGGTIVFLGARIFGGSGGFGATLSSVALVSAVNILGIVQLIPFAQVAGTFLLGLLATYVAVRETHAISPWRSFGVALFGPLLLALLVLVVGCIFFLLIGSLAGA